MWVMDQDEKSIVRCSCIGVHIEDERKIIAVSDDGDSTTGMLGTYKTKERAKRVLLDLSLAIAKDKKIFYMPKE